MADEIKRPYRRKDLRPLTIIVEGVYETWAKLGSRTGLFDWPSVETVENCDILWLNDDELREAESNVEDPKYFEQGDLVYVYSLDWQGTAMVHSISNFRVNVTTDMGISKTFPKENVILLSRIKDHK